MMGKYNFLTKTEMMDKSDDESYCTMLCWRKFIEPIILCKVSQKKQG